MALSSATSPGVASAQAQTGGSALAELRVGTVAALSGIDPRTAKDVPTHTVLRQIFAPPFVLEAGKSKPYLFVDHLRLESGSERTHPVYRAHIRKDFVFSDGTPLTSEIIAKSLTKTSALKGKAAISADGDGVVFTLDEPNPNFELLLTQTYCNIVLEKGTELLGCGPFMFEKGTTARSAMKAKTIRLVRNPHFPRPVAMDSVVVTLFPPEADGRPVKLLEACTRGQVDFTTCLTSVDAARLPLAVVYPSIQYGVSTGLLSFNTTKPALANPVLRRAMAIGLDRAAIAKQSFEKNPLAFLGKGILPSTLDPTEIDMFPFNARESQKLFEEAGSKPAKLTLVIPWCPRPYAPNPLLMGNEIKRQYDALGIPVEVVEPRGSEDFYERQASGNYDLMLSGWIPDTPDPSDTYESLLASNRIPQGSGGHPDANNVSRISSPAIDSAIAAYRRDPTAVNKRVIESLVQLEAPLVPVTKGQSVTILSRRVKNFVPSPDGVYSFEHLQLNG